MQINHILFHKRCKAGFNKNHVAFRCSNGQLHSFVKRYNHNHRSHIAIYQLPVVQFEEHVQGWIAQQRAPAERERSDLIILQNTRAPSITENEIVVSFVCDGMLNRIRDTKGRYLKLVIDAKQNVVAKTGCIVIAGWVANRQEQSNTRVR